MSTRKITAIAVIVIVALSCVPWIRQLSLFSALVAVAAIALLALLVFGGFRRITALLRPTQTLPVNAWPRLRKIATFVVVVVFLTLTVPHFIATNMSAYKLAVSTARQNPRFAEALGGAPRENWFSEGKWEGGKEPRAEVSIPVRGELRNGTLSAAAAEVNGKWELTKLALEIEQPKQEIDLLSSAHLTAKTSCPTVEERGVPKNSLYTLVLVPPAGEACAAAPDFTVGKQTLQDFGTIGHPVRGWVGCDGQEPLQGVLVESYSGDGKQRLASTTTNQSGKFALPDLKEGTYQLVITGGGIAQNKIIVRSSRESNAAACVFAVAEQDSR